MVCLQGGSSSNPCSEVYHGASAASEPETQNAINYFKTVTDPANPVYGAIDWHSFGQLILRPYGMYDPANPVYGAIDWHSFGQLILRPYDPANPVYGAIDWHSFGQLILRPYGLCDCTRSGLSWHRMQSDYLSHQTLSPLDFWVKGLQREKTNKNNYAYPISALEIARC